MTKIKSLELEKWSEPDENGFVRKIGMANAKNSFESLKQHLTKFNMLPDEYFFFNGPKYRLDGDLPEFDQAVCIPSYGESEGIYLDINLLCFDDHGHQEIIPFATGKTLKESGDDFLRMARIAAECSLMLNGRGAEYERKDMQQPKVEPLSEAEMKSLEQKVGDQKVENIRMRLGAFLKERKEMAWFKISTLSKTLLMTEPKNGRESEWTEAYKDANLIEHLISKQEEIVQLLSNEQPIQHAADQENFEEDWEWES